MGWWRASDATIESNTPRVTSSADEGGTAPTKGELAAEPSTVNGGTRQTSELRWWWRRHSDKGSTNGDRGWRSRGATLGKRYRAWQGQTVDVAQHASRLVHDFPAFLATCRRAVRRTLEVCRARIKRLDSAAVLAFLRRGVRGAVRRGLLLARQTAVAIGRAGRDTPRVASRTGLLILRASARELRTNGLRLCAAARSRARASWVWLRTDAPVLVRHGKAKVRIAAPSFLVTIVAGGTTLGLLLALFIPLVGSRVASYQPSSSRLQPLSVRSTVYAANGTTLANLGYEDREPISYQNLSPLVIDAVVATEDRTFWTNPGVDPAGLVRAAVSDLGSGAVQQGGSTITEQLVKNRIMNPKRDLKKKVTEAVLAMRLNRRLSKRQILTEYLNTVYFGEGAYGVQAAAERYFVITDPGSVLPRGKEPRELNLAEAAMLAGLIANPTGFDPFTLPGAARARRHEVLERMLAAGYITPAEVRFSDASPLPNVPPSSPDLQPRDLWVAQVQTDLLTDPRLGATPQERLQLLLRGGLRVYTTLDQQAQFYAQNAVNQILPNQPPFTAALIAMDPTNGDVKAMVGGPGFDQLQYNIATHPPGRQTGSTFKVITLAAALEAGYSPNDSVNGTSPCTAVRSGFPPWATVNAEQGVGTMSLRQATVNSVNCAFAHVIASLGPPAVVDMAHRLGVTGQIPDYLPITLGVASTTPLEMATVISTIADQGVRHDPVFVSKVVGPDGHVYIDNTQPSGQRVLDASIADCETDMLHGVITGGTGTAAQLPGRDAAGKTGTTDSFGDAWFDGFTPQLATTVWMGATTGELPMSDVGGIQVFGGTYPARIWQAFMAAELANQPAVPLPPAGPVCDRPGAPISDAGRGVPGPVPVASPNRR